MAQQFHAGHAPKGQENGDSGAIHARTFTAARRWGQAPCPSTERQTTWSIHTVRYCSAFKRREIPTQTTPWMDSENTMPIEVNQSP